MHIYMYIIKQSLTGHVIMNTFGPNYILNNCPQGISVYKYVYSDNHPQGVLEDIVC